MKKINFELLESYRGGGETTDETNNLLAYCAGLTASMGIVALVNSWNPLGWAAAGVGIGCSVYSMAQ